MIRSMTVILALGAVAVLWVGTAAQQEVKDRPGFGSGVMDVRVVNHPAVTAVQSGEWRVAVANTADVRIADTATVATAAPPFARTGSSYKVTWDGGSSETVTFRQLGSNGWVEVEQGAGRRWINLNNARAVEEAR